MEDETELAIIIKDGVDNLGVHPRLLLLRNGQSQLFEIIAFILHSRHNHFHVPIYFFIHFQTFSKNSIKRTSHFKRLIMKYKRQTEINIYFLNVDAKNTIKSLITIIFDN